VRAKAAVSWSGGKDCNLALLRCLDREDIDTVALVCFHPPSPTFRAHPLKLQRLQAEALSLQYVMVEVNAARHEGDFKRAYVEAIKSLKSNFGIDMIVTGDIDYVGSSKSNFIQEVCETAACGITCWLPLWQQNREVLIQEMLERQLKIIFSCVKSPHFDETWILKKLDKACFDELIQKREEDNSLDVCGENGEYHTMVVGGPHYKKEIELKDFFPHELHDMPGQKEGIRWWAIQA